jgi:outer membrane protein assembly factor BamB
VVSRDVVFAGSHSGLVEAVDIRTGQKAWSLPTAIITTPWAAGDVVYVVDQQGRVICIARDSGQIYWIRGLNDGLRKKFRAVYSSPILASNRLVMVTNTGVAVALDPKTGSTLKTLRLGAPAFVSPIAADGIIFVLTNTGELIAIR